MKTSIKKIKTLLIYQVYRAGIDKFYEAHIHHLREHGFDIEGFCITIDPPNSRLSYSCLDKLWKENDKRLFNIYEQLISATRNKDVTVLYNGANLHPEFLPQLKTFNAYMCFDDPESSDNLSKPVARFFDVCFVGNIACLNLYQSWGCKNVFFRPLGYFQTHLSSKNITENEILQRHNEVDVCLFCERVSEWRKERLDYLYQNISNLYARGKGWPSGWVSDEVMLEIYSKAKMGINLHNSTGPINLRTYVLPANGVMQICDNKYFLGHIFELGKEVIGYNDIQEVPELVKFYLTHEDERKKIAVAGWKRATNDYNEVSVWKKQMEQIRELI
jgi:hypothetical protein